jgi:hypothetical protein
MQLLDAIDSNMRKEYTLEGVYQWMTHHIIPMAVLAELVVHSYPYKADIHMTLLVSCRGCAVCCVRCVCSIVWNGAWLELVVHSYPYKADIHMTLLVSEGMLSSVWGLWVLVVLPKCLSFGRCTSMHGADGIHQVDTGSTRGDTGYTRDDTGFTRGDTGFTRDDTGFIRPGGDPVNRRYGERLERY